MEQTIVQGGLTFKKVKVIYVCPNCGKDDMTVKTAGLKVNTEGRLKRSYTHRCKSCRYELELTRRYPYTTYKELSEV